MVSIQRELAPNTVASASYVGSRGHHILVIRQANPGNPALCLSVSEPSQVAPGSPTCGPFAENGVFVTKAGQVINGTRGPLGPNFGTVTRAGNDGVLALQRARAESSLYAAGRACSPATRYSKSVDVASNLGEQVNPFDVSRRKRRRRSTCATISSSATTTICRSIASSAGTTR